MTDSSPPPNAPEPLTAQELDAIKALEAKATPGTWEYHPGAGGAVMMTDSFASYNPVGHFRRDADGKFVESFANNAKRLIAELSSFRAVCRVCGVAGAAELGEFLAALPKTADGKPITPKTELWHPKDLAAGFDKPVTGDWLRSQMNCPRWGNYYSTRAAALASMPQAAGTQEQRSGR